MGKINLDSLESIKHTLHFLKKCECAETRLFLISSIEERLDLLEKYIMNLLDLNNDMELRLLKISEMANKDQMTLDMGDGFGDEDL